MEQMKKAEGPITNLDEVLKDSGEQTVELAGWVRAKPFVARLRRVSLLGMIAAGKVPNHLMSAVLELYQKNRLESGSQNVKVLGETMMAIARACLVEPTLEQITEKGIELTDLQLTQIYSFATQGVDALRPFREEQNVSAPGQDGENVHAAAQRLAGDM